MPFTLRRTPATTRYYTESLDDLGEAIPLQMLLIPAGTFMMGSPEDEPKRSQNEAQHEVTVPPFFLGRYPVTQAQWRAVAALPQVKRAIEPAPSHFKGDNRPVEQVSWYEAVEFCDRLQQHTGRPYRLPSEAEWEYACRAGTTSPFHFGKTLTTEVANYLGNDTYADGPKGEFRGEATPVDHFEITTVIMSKPLRMAVLGFLMIKSQIACYVAVPGSTTRGIAAPLPATSVRSTTATAASVFE
jgi:formylglycine-generating enzyme required for sulfatase activity